MGGQNFDQEGVVIAKDDGDERLYASWADLCEPAKVEERKLRNGKWIKYRPWLPSDKMAEIQLICRGPRRGQKWDTAKFYQLVLQEVMIEPKIRTQQDKQSAMKADSAVILNIINQTVGDEMFTELQEEVGE